MAERLKFSIYCRKSGRLINLYRINRTPTGLYLNDPHNPMKAMKQVGEVKRVGVAGGPSGGLRGVTFGLRNGQYALWRAPNGAEAVVLEESSAHPSNFTATGADQ